jgi:hypothetical protein
MGSVRQVTTINPPAPKMPSKVVYGYLSYIGTSTAPVVTLGGKHNKRPTTNAPCHKAKLKTPRLKHKRTWGVVVKSNANVNVTTVAGV